jgi:dTDP-4-amino-4,6-dideoxygalactose transaminase
MGTLLNTKKSAENNMTQKIKSWPDFSSDEINSVTQLLANRSFASQAKDEVLLFEKECAKLIERKHALAVANDTIALELALSAIGIQKNDEIILPARISIEVAAPVINSGAVPVIADIDRQSLNIATDDLETLITENTKAIICLHHAGWPCDMDSLIELAEKYSLKVIEICSQAQGAKYKNHAVGFFSHVAIFSFGADAIVSTGGEGGMLLCDDDEIFNRARHSLELQSAAMTAMQAALGRSQLLRLAEMVEHRRENAARFKQAFSELEGLKISVPAKEYYHSYNYYYCFLDTEKLKPGITSDFIVQKLSEKGVPICQPVCGEIYKEKAFESLDLPAGFPTAANPLPKAKLIDETAIMLPVHPALTEENIDYIIQILTGIINASGASGSDQKEVFGRDCLGLKKC